MERYRRVIKSVQNVETFEVVTAFARIILVLVLVTWICMPLIDEFIW